MSRRIRVWLIRHPDRFKLILKKVKTFYESSPSHSSSQREATMSKYRAQYSRSFIRSRFKNSSLLLPLDRSTFFLVCCNVAQEYIKGKKIYSSNFRQTFSSSFPQTKPLTESAALLRAAQVLPRPLLAAGAACAWSAASNVIIKSFDKLAEESCSGSKSQQAAEMG